MNTVFLLLYGSQKINGEYNSSYQNLEGCGGGRDGERMINRYRGTIGLKEKLLTFFIPQ
jgi:hypothetical protein